MEETFSIECLNVPYDFQYSAEFLPEKDITGTFYYLKSPIDITIDIRKIRSIRSGVIIQHPSIVEKRKGTNVINVSKYFVQPIVGPYAKLAEMGLVQLSPTVVFSGQPIEITFYNLGTENVTIKKGDIIGCLSLLLCPQVQLTPRLSPYAAMS